MGETNSGGIHDLEKYKRKLKKSLVKNELRLKHLNVPHDFFKLRLSSMMMTCVTNLDLSSELSNDDDASEDVAHVPTAEVVASQI